MALFAPVWNDVAMFHLNPEGCEPLFSAKDAFQFLPLTDITETEVVTLAGNLYTGADVVAQDIALPKLDIGDIVTITNAGSYAATLSPTQFSSQIPPVEIIIEP